LKLPLAKFLEITTYCFEYDASIDPMVSPMRGVSKKILTILYLIGSFTRRHMRMSIGEISSTKCCSRS